MDLLSSSIYATLALYLSFTPTFFYGWAVGKTAHKRYQINTDTTRLALLTPFGFFYIIAVLNFLTYLSNFKYFYELIPVLSQVSLIFVRSFGMTLVYKDLPHLPLETAHIVFIIPAIFCSFLIYLPFSVGKKISQMYFSKNSMHLKVMEIFNQLKMLKIDFENKLQEIESAKKSLGKDSSNGIIIVGGISKILIYFLNSITWLIIALVILESIERFVYWLFRLKHIFKFSIEFMTKNISIQEIETTTGWGFQLVTIDISTSENKIISGVLKDYHVLNDGLSYFTLEKVYKREKSKRTVKEHGFHSDKFTEEHLAHPIYIPGEYMVVPLDKVVDFNIFKSKKEVHLKLEINVIDVDKNADLNQFNDEDRAFISREILNIIDKYHSGRIVYTKVIFFYHKDFSALFEKIVPESIKDLHFVLKPEFIDYGKSTDTIAHLKKYYTFFEIINYQKELKILLSRSGTKTTREVKQTIL